MDINEAIQSIASNDTLTGFVADNAIKSNQIVEFTQYICDQYHRDGNSQNLIDCYGEEEIKTILQYAKTINARAESICMSKCIEDDNNNQNDK